MAIAHLPQRKSRNSLFGQIALTQLSVGVFKQGSLDTYRFCDEVWTFLIKNVNLKVADSPSPITCDKIKIVSCSAKKDQAAP